MQKLTGFCVLQSPFVTKVQVHVNKISVSLSCTIYIHDLYVSFSQYCCHITPLCPPWQNLSTFHSESQFLSAGLDAPSAVALQIPCPDPFLHCSVSPECPLPIVGAYGCLAGRTVGFGPTAGCPASFGSPAWALPDASPCFLPAQWWSCSPQGWCPWSFNKIHSTVWTLIESLNQDLDINSSIKKKVS